MRLVKAVPVRANSSPKLNLCMPKGLVVIASSAVNMETRRTRVDLIAELY